MVLEKSVLINAPLSSVWKTIVHIQYWNTWSSVMRDVSSESEILEKRTSFRFCVHLFTLPICVEPAVDEIIPEQRIVWSGKKFGVLAQHEFSFQIKNEKVQLISREIFSGINRWFFHVLFPKTNIDELSTRFLSEIKEASERR